MSDADATAEWKLLPHSPQAFFRLDDDFDRKALKRAYNKLLKQFKPEKFPDEFQKLRSAYESLERELRYGKQLKSTVEREQYQWNMASADTATPTKAIEKKSERLPFHERLKRESPAKIYRELSAQSNKTPYDFFTLALCADVVTDDPLRFVQWILMGVKEHPTDQGLLNLLKQYFETDIDPRHLPKLLFATSKIVRDEMYYYLTESCWQKILRNEPFEVFKSILSKCEKNLKLFSDRGRGAFYAHILRQAIWKADSKWLDHVFNFLNQQATGLSEDADRNLMMLEQMREYIGDSQRIIGDNPLRKRIHETIVEYFSSDVETADRAVIECQLELADDSQSLLSSFPVSFSEKDTDSFAPLWIIWNAISEEVMERNGISPKRVSNRKFNGRLFKLMKDLDSTWGIKPSQIVSYYALAWIPYLLFVVLPFILFAGWLPIMLVSVPLMFVGVAAYHFWLKPKTVDPIFFRIIQRSIRKQYLSLWRGRFVQLLEATQAEMGELSQGLFQIVYGHQTSLTAATHLVDFVPRDFGIAFYSQAARFRS